MKFIYVLVSSTNDFYYEQVLMSVFSLREYEPAAEIFFFVDDKTNATFTKDLKREELKKIATKIISVDFDETKNALERSRFLKTTIPNYIEGEFLFIDCDTIICNTLSEISNINADIAAVLDGHSLLSDHVHKDHFYKYDKKMGFKSFLETDKNFNSGVIYCKNNEACKKVFEKWHELWKFCEYEKHDHHDQPAFNEAIFLSEVKFEELDGEWNCQPSSGGLEFLGEAKIIHYFSSEFDGKNYVPYYKLADKNLQMRIKEAGNIPDDIKAMIKNPRFQFNKVYLIKDQRIVSIMQSPLIFTFAEMKMKAPVLFKFFEGCASFARTIGKKLKYKNTREKNGNKIESFQN